MTTPDDAVPVEPAVTPDEAAAQAAAQEAAAASAAQANAIRALAAEIAKQTLLDFDPATLRKGVVASIASTTTPPTLGITISGDTTVIPGVRYIDSYAPEVDDVVLIIKQGTDLVALGEIAGQFSESSWTLVDLADGFIHNGNSNGDVEIRRIWDHGCWKVQMKGGASRSSGSVICEALPAMYRPSTRRSLLSTRTAVGGANVVKIDIEPSGVVNLVGGTTTPGASDSTTTGSTTPATSTHSHGAHEHVIEADAHTHGSHQHAISLALNPPYDHYHSGSTGSATPASDSHSHTGTTYVTAPAAVDHNHGSHNHSVGSHVHPVEDPVWISFNQIEYFL